MTPEETAVLERFRAICLALPEVEERDNLDADPDWDAVEGVVRDAYRKVAPKTLAARLG